MTEGQILATGVLGVLGFILHFEFRRAQARGVSMGRALLEFGAVAVLLGYVVYTVAYS